MTRPSSTAAKAGSVVAAAADGDGQAVVAPEIDRGDHVGDVGAAGDQQRPLVDHAVVERARLLVAWVLRLDELTAQRGLQLRDFAVSSMTFPSSLRGRWRMAVHPITNAPAKAPK